MNRISQTSAANLLQILVFAGIISGIISCQEEHSRAAIYGEMRSVKSSRIKTPQYVILGQRLGEKFIPLDSAEFDEGKYYFNQLNVPLPGRYELHVSKNKYLINYFKNEDLPLKMDFVFDGKNSLVPFTGTNEAINIQELKKLYDEFQDNISPLYGELLPITRSGKHWHELTIKDSLRVWELKAFIHDERVIFSDKLKNYAGSHPNGGYATEVLLNLVYLPEEAWIGHENRKPSRFIPEVFIEAIPFHDPRIINDPEFEDRLFQYMGIDSYETADFVHRVNYIMTKAGANQQVYHFVYDYYINAFKEFGPPEMIEYLKYHYKWNINLPTME